MSDNPDYDINHPYETIADAIADLYIGEVLQIYLGESGGTTNYADYDVDQKIFIEGRVLWAKGLVIAVECGVVTPNKIYKKVILINAWGITAVMPKGDDGIQISHIIQGTKR